jgi:hypothetical protein
MEWLKQNWRPVATLLASVGVGVALHFGKLSVDQAILAGGILAGIGVHLDPLVWKVGPK